ncbi:MAG TPA: 3-hydroxyacyl-CoA dehydrogenase NAD-binding domain-containing protein [Hyphomicrobiales bacterium]|nr:3-hydroxyacyl-CoA dehydrogenase NAD-binding domain-containing protein [Hyphomicrobiales bacterium]
MAELVSISRDGDVAVLTIDNPPVNALGHTMRIALAAALDGAVADPAAKGIVIAAAGRMFSGGVDIHEFNAPARFPTLPDLIAKVEASPKPVVAALHGIAYGGALELSLACHGRVAAPDAKLGLPEVKIGLIPGAGGTQRLPRAIGPLKALQVIVAGEPLAAPDALAAGLVSAVGADVVAEAKALARKLAAGPRPLPLLRNDDSKLAPVKADRTAFDAAVADVAKKARGLTAPVECAKAVAMTLELPIDEGLKRERATFDALTKDAQSLGLRHHFFAEREATKPGALPAGTEPHAVARAAVIGAGTMGGGIAMCFANAGIPVTLVDTGDEALKRGLATIERNYATTVKRGRLSETEMAARMARITPTTDIGAVADADIVIEAVFEEMDLKKRVFAELDRLARPDAVLATNTSYLDVDAIAATTKRPGSVLGTHFFSPANVMRLLEVVRGKATRPDVLATAMALGRKLGKVPVPVGVCHGFVGNRMLHARAIEAEPLLLEGALPQDIDGALTAFGFPMGPFAMGDMAGLDVGWRIRKATGEQAEIADALCEKGRFGQKTGRGFYIYEAGSRTPTPDPEVEALIAETAARRGVTRRKIGADEIIERLLYPLVSEGAQILDEGIARRPGDIDVVWVYGYGFPAWRGGPMYWADQVGLGHIRDRLLHYAERNPALKPSPLLSRLADEGRGFASLDGVEKAA